MFCAEAYEHPPITSLTPDAKVFCAVRAFSEGSAYAKGFCAVAGSSKWCWASNLLLMMCCDDEASLSFTEASNFVHVDLVGLPILRQRNREKRTPCNPCYSSSLEKLIYISVPDSPTTSHFGIIDVG